VFVDRFRKPVVFWIASSELYCPLEKLKNNGVEVFMTLSKVIVTV
jgi:hypothetical protein